MAKKDTSDTPDRWGVNDNENASTSVDEDTAPGVDRDATASEGIVTRTNNGDRDTEDRTPDSTGLPARELSDDEVSDLRTRVLERGDPADILTLMDHYRR